jgi:hypothetical protein
MRKILLPFLCLALAACQSDDEFDRASAPASTQPSPIRPLRIDWYGYECFQFTSALGLKILVNPYRESAFSGRIPDVKPEVVLMTSDEPAFNNDEAYSNTPVTYRGPIANGLNNAAGIRIRGIPTVKDESSGTERVNLVFSWTMDGLRICFAGNLRRPLTSYELGQLGKVDVLFLPVGVPAGLTDSDREAIIRQLNPHIIIPMGPSGSVSSANFGGFNSYRLNGSSVFLTRENLLMEPTTLILSAP